MNRKTLNVIIGITLGFIVIFFAGSYAYKSYQMQKSDERYEQTVDKETGDTAQENQSGQTNEEAKDN
ncbi:MAG: hypothetical protein IJW59_00755 [Clostridia bacterium]|nr:hypothetical protein [Clostridia bacterium]